MAAPEDNRALAAGAAPTPTGTARRKLLIGSAPVILTLASRPALAGICTASAAASFNANNSSGNPVAGQNCAVGPTCWTERAEVEGMGAWLGTGYSPDQLFSSTFAGTGLLTSGTTQDTWRVSATATLGNALAFQVPITYYRNNGNQWVMTNGADLAAEAVAALLNASFNQNYPNDYVYTESQQVIDLMKALWLYVPPPPSSNDQDQANAQVTSRRDAFVAARSGGVQCDLAI